VIDSIDGNCGILSLIFESSPIFCNFGARYLNFGANIIQISGVGSFSRPKREVFDCTKIDLIGILSMIF